mmetsp:Transcript_156273/g.291580  ORF Transcript_156273/g.291580 Transcript_156273/m.291580 type:complete len:80 (-) Transcript_156273:978-1217(-)
MPAAAAARMAGKELFLEGVCKRWELKARAKVRLPPLVTMYWPSLVPQALHSTGYCSYSGHVSAKRLNMAMLERLSASSV